MVGGNPLGTNHTALREVHTYHHHDCYFHHHHLGATLVMPLEGCATRCAQVPSLVTSSRPVVAESRRPTATSRGGSLHSMVKTTYQSLAYSGVLGGSLNVTAIATTTSIFVDPTKTRTRKSGFKDTNQTELVGYTNTDRRESEVDTKYETKNMVPRQDYKKGA